MAASRVVERAQGRTARSRLASPPPTTAERRNWPPDTAWGAPVRSRKHGGTRRRKVALKRVVAASMSRLLMPCVSMRAGAKRAISCWPWHDVLALNVRTRAARGACSV